jgi:hypothetical protein
MPTIDLGRVVGSDGLTPHIGDNGNWYIGDTDTGVKAIGVDGKDGIDGKDGTDGKNGTDGKDGKDGKDGVDGKNGTDGTTPVRGVDYWTDADKEEIVTDVLNAMNDAEEAVF